MKVPIEGVEGVTALDVPDNYTPDQIERAKQLAAKTQMRLKGGATPQEGPPSVAQGWQDAADLAIPIAAGEAASVAATPFGTPVRAVASGAAQAGGYIASQALHPLITGQPIPPLSELWSEAKKQGLITAGVEAGVPYAGAVAGTLGKKLVPLIPETVSPETKAIEQQLMKANVPGQTLGQIARTENPKSVSSIMENVAYSALSTRYVNKIYKAQQVGYQDYLKGVTTKLSQLSPDQAGMLLTGNIKDNTDFFIRYAEDTIYDGIRGRLGAKFGAGNDQVISVGKLLTPLINASKSASQSESVLQRINTLLKGSKHGIDISTMASANLVTFDDAMKLKTALGEVSRTAEKGNATQFEKYVGVEAARLSDDLSKQITKNLRGIDPGTAQMFTDIQRHGKAAREIFTHDYVTSVVKALSKEPGEIYRVMTDPTTLQQLKFVKASMDKGMWEQTIQPYLYAGLRGRASELNGEMTGAALTKELERLTPGGSLEFVNELLPKGAFQELKDMAATLTKLEEKATGVGTMSIQTQQPAAVKTMFESTLGAVTSPLGAGMAGAGAGAAAGSWMIGLGTAGAVFLTPMMFARIVAKPERINKLKEGIVASYGTGKVPDWFATFIRQTAAAAYSSSGRVGQPAQGREPTTQP